MQRAGNLEKAAANAERQIWKRAQLMSPQAPLPSHYFDEAAVMSAGGGDVQWSMSSVEALDQMQKTHENKIETARRAHQKEAMDLRKENAFLKQRLKGVVASHNHELRSSHQHAQLQTALLELQTQSEVKERELQNIRDQNDALTERLQNLRLDHATEACARERGSGLSQMGEVLAKWTRDAKFGAIFMWRTQWMQQKPAQIDRAKVRALEAEAQGYRSQIENLTSDVKEAMAEVNQQKIEHVDQVKALKREKTALETILSQSSDNAEVAVLRREILQLKSQKQEREAELTEEIANLKTDLRLAKQ
jgi:cell division protein FtsB